VSVIAQATDTNGNVYVGGLTGGTLASADENELENAGGLDVFVRKYDVDGNEIWTRQFGGLLDDQAIGLFVDSTSLYVAGFVGGTLPGHTSAGGVDAFVRKYDLNGNEMWTRQFGTASDDQGRGVFVDATGVYVSGATAGTFPGQVNSGFQDAFLRKYDTDGVEVWTRQFGSSGTEQPNGIAGDASGVYVAGLTTGTLPGQTSAGGNDAFVRKYDADGTHVWTRQFGTTAIELPLDVSVDDTGVYISGLTGGVFPTQISAGGLDAFVRKYTADGVVAWTRQFGTSGSEQANSVSVDASGVYVAGSVSGAFPGQINSGGQDAFIRKYDANGNAIWTHQFGSPVSDQGLGVSVDFSGVYVVGQTNGALPGQIKTGSTDAFVRRYELAGPPTVRWTRQFGTLGPTADSAQAADANGNIYVTGQTPGSLDDQTNQGLNDAFLRKYDADGNEIWTRLFGTVVDDQSRGVAVDGQNVYVAGFTGGTFAGQISNGGIDAFLRKYDADGNVVWTRQFGTNLIDQASAIAVDSTGIYVAGFVTPLSFTQTTPQDGFVYKYDANGNQVWVRQIATAGIERALGIFADASGVYVSGFTDGILPGQTNLGTQDAFVRKYDVNGIEAWTRQFGSSGQDQAAAVSVTNATAVYVAGNTTGALPGQSSAGSFDVFVAQFDIDGNPAWTRQFGTAGGDQAGAIASDATGAYVAGFVGASGLGQVSGNAEAFVRKYDIQGTVLWNLEFGTEAGDRATGIAVDSTGIYVAGNIGNFPDAFVLKLVDFVPVQIDIKPGTFPNTVNLGSSGAVPVAILSSPSFDARSVDPLSVVLAGATIKLKGNGAPLFSLQDINDDGLVDMLVHVTTQALELTETDSDAILTARISDGQRVRGTDSVRIVP
jgi:hypothetical protein